MRINPVVRGAGTLPGPAEPAVSEGGTRIPSLPLASSRLTRQHAEGGHDVLLCLAAKGRPAECGQSVRLEAEAPDGGQLRRGREHGGEA